MADETRDGFIQSSRNTRQTFRRNVNTLQPIHKHHFHDVGRRKHTAITGAGLFLVDADDVEFDVMLDPARMNLQILGDIARFDRRPIVESACFFDPLPCLLKYKHDLYSQIKIY